MNCMILAKIVFEKYSFWIEKSPRILSYKELFHAVDKTNEVFIGIGEKYFVINLFDERKNQGTNFTALNNNNYLTRYSWKNFNFLLKAIL